MAKNAITSAALGYLKRWGFCDFTGDGSFDPGTEIQQAINDEASPPSGVPNYYVKVAAGLLVEMTAPEKAAIDVALLQQFKEDKSRTFDQHTKRILITGVEYPASSGDFYSIAPDALTAIQAMIDVGVYPFLVHSLGYTGLVTINSATQANSMLGVARNKMVAVLQEGATLLAQIAAAPDKATLDAIVDPR
jgi:hypothetical protein